MATTQVPLGENSPSSGGRTSGTKPRNSWGSDALVNSPAVLGSGTGATTLALAEGLELAVGVADTDP